MAKRPIGWGLKSSVSFEVEGRHYIHAQAPSCERLQDQGLVSDRETRLMGICGIYGYAHPLTSRGEKLYRELTHKTSSQR